MVPIVLTFTLCFFFVIPFPSHFTVFKIINPPNVFAPVVSIISVTISTDQTIVWWDHWEDGYDADVAVGTGPKTEIWGDHNAKNGCAPSIKNCTDFYDSLMAGDAIVVQNTVPIPRMKANYFYDGGDRIQSSFPVAVTRSAYAANPGTLLAGASTCDRIINVCGLLIE